MSTRSILNVKILPFQRPQAIEFLLDRIMKRIPTRITFANANLLNTACIDSDLCLLLDRFVIFNDGSGVNIASRVLYGQPFPSNLNGTDFCPALLDSSDISLRIYLLGARQSVLTQAAIAISSRWPQHTVVGTQHGYYAQADFDRIKEEINSVQPDVVFVAMGNGKQERVVDDLVSSHVPVALGVGALFDFLTGEVSRAPRAFQALGLEWVYRLFLEPRRLWRRYVIGNPVFLWRVLLQRLKITRH